MVFISDNFVVRNVARLRLRHDDAVGGFFGAPTGRAANTSFEGANKTGATPEPYLEQACDPYWSWRRQQVPRCASVFKTETPQRRCEGSTSSSRRLVIFDELRQNKQDEDPHRRQRIPWIVRGQYLMPLKPIVHSCPVPFPPPVIAFTPSSPPCVARHVRWQSPRDKTRVRDYAAAPHNRINRRRIYTCCREYDQTSSRPANNYAFVTVHNSAV